MNGSGTGCGLCISGTGNGDTSRIASYAARGLPEHDAAIVAAATRRWWKNSALLIHRAFPIRYFDQLGIPRLAS
jgi:hypothetical protein